MVALFAAFILGAMGSLHCVGMCGPLALSLPVVKPTFLSGFAGSLLYNAGRISMYALLGAMLGSIGLTAALFGFQQWLSLAVGILLLMVLLMQKNKMLGATWLPFYSVIRKWLGALYVQKKYRTFFLIGLLNGLLPCGLVYIAMAGAISTGSVWQSATFMLFFGLGTLPLMWMVSFFGNVIGLRVRNNIKKWYPYMMGFMACLLIIRGLGLGIPYISPQWHSNSDTISCHE